MVALGGSTRRLVVFAARPHRTFLTVNVPGGPDGLTIRSVPNIGPTALRSGSTSWASALSRAALTVHEREVWRDLAAPPRRRNEWLLGRIAMKDAVRAWLVRSRGLALAPRDLEIATTAAGAPYVRWPGDTGVQAPLDVPSISLSHSAQTVIAIAGQPALGVGVDVESQQRSVGALARALSEEERAILDSLALGVLDAFVAKEAAAKAMGSGLGGSVRRWPIVGGSAAPQPELVVAALTPRGEPLTVRLLTSQGNTIAVCVSDPHHISPIAVRE